MRVEVFCGVLRKPWSNCWQGDPARRCVVSAEFVLDRSLTNAEQILGLRPRELMADAPPRSMPT